jgi:hypothetical protein
MFEWLLLSGAAEHSIPTYRADILVQSIVELGLHCKHDIHAVGQTVVRKAEQQSLMAACMCDDAARSR